MPHVIVEYSANIENEITPQRLVDEIHAAAIASGIAEPVAVRTRLKRREHFRVGDGSPENAFVHIDIRARKGRTLEQKKHAVQTIYDQANKTLDPGIQGAPARADGGDPRDRSGDAAVAQRHARAAGQRRMSGTLDKTIARAEGFLKRFREKPVAHLIDGKQDGGSGATFETLSPIDNSVIAQVARGGAAEIDRAAKAATKAFRTGWSRTTGDERRKLLHKIADAIEARADEIALVESIDTGQPIRYMSKAAVRGAENFRFYADRAPGANDGLSLPTDTHLNYTIRQPIGPVGVITPWNTPFMLSTWKIAPALAAGCTVVHKPAEWSPLTAVSALGNLPRSRVCRRACSTPCTASARTPARRSPSTPTSRRSASSARARPARPSWRRAQRP